MTDPTPAAPTTQAGQRLLSGPNMRRALLSDIIAIEAETKSRVLQRAKGHRPTVYTGSESHELIRCECGHRNHPAGWFAHLTVEVMEFGNDE